MFGTVVDKIQSLLSRSFLLGNFFPVLVFAIINLVIAWLAVDGFAELIGTKWLTDATTFSTVTAASLVAVAIVAFMVAPLIPVMRRMLQGELLVPKFIRDSQISVYRAAAQQADEARRVAGRDYSFFELKVQEAANRFEAARAAQAPRNLDRATLDSAQRAFEDLVHDIASKDQDPVPRERLPDRNKTDEAVKQIAAALAQYPMNPQQANYAADIAVILETMQGEFNRNLSAAKTLSYRLLQVAEAEARTNFVLDDIRPTQVGNSRAAMEQYPSIAYQVEYEFLWPRLRMVLPNDKTIAAAVETATAQLDFSVLMTVFFAVSAAIWIPVLGVTSTSLALYTIVGLLLPLLTIFFYELVHETQKALRNVMETAIDALRFDVLKAQIGRA